MTKNGMEEAVAFGKKLGQDLGKVYTPVGQHKMAGTEEEVALGTRMAKDFSRNARGKI